MKRFFLFLGFFLLITSINSSELLSSKNGIGESAKKLDNNWLNDIQRDIYKSTYNFIKDENSDEYHSINSDQNLKFTYNKNGFVIEPLESNKGDWHVNITLEKLSKGSSNSIFKGNKFTANDNIASIEDDVVKINYDNSSNGMRQDFIIKNRLAYNEANLKIILGYKTNLKSEVHSNGIAFKNDNNIVINYDKLKVWDASNKILSAKMQKVDKKHFAIVVNDKNAIYPITIDPLSYVPDWTAHGQMEGEQFGISASTAGDINGDGYDDIIVGADGSNNGGYRQGKVYVYFGGANGPSTTADWTASSSQDNGAFGFSVASAGDVNGDGYDDALIGAYGKSNGQDGEGIAYLYYGSASGLPATADWFNDGDQYNAYFGHNVIGAGDLNGDGYDDIAISAYGYDADSANYDVGRVYVYYGSSTGIPDSPNWIVTGDIIEGDFGYSISSAGDVNGDGYDELLIGQDEYKDSNGDYLGKAYLYYGTDNGLTYDSLWTVVSDQSSSSFGTRVANYGDINNDGYDDFGISAPYYDESSSNTGKLFVYYGSSNGPSDTADWTAASPNFDDYLDRPAYIGDINGDGYDDISATSIVYGNCQGDEGKVFIWYGGANGPEQTSGTYDNADWSYEANQQYARGGQIFGAGDVNNDGISDFMVTAFGFDVVANNDGKVDLFFGTTKPNKPIGDGTEQNPYQISSLRDLNWLSETDSVWDKHFIQTADINASNSVTWDDGDCGDPDGFKTIGNYDNYFTGTYDGQNHIIDSVYIYRPGDNVIGLFGELNAATVKNLMLKNVDITGRSTVGGLVGYSFYSTISNCSTSGSVKGNNYMHGGLIGNSNFSSVENSSSSASVSGTEMVGGLIGNAANTEITLCRAVGTATGTDASVGGFTGKNVNSKIYRCSSYGNVTGASKLGGFVGFNDAQSLIQNSFSMGNVERLDGEISTNNASFCGSNDNNSTIKYCYSIGSVSYVNSTNPTDKGFVGESVSGNYVDNFWDTENSGQSSTIASAASGKLTSEMMVQSTFTNWDFSTPVWEINSAVNDGYPYISGIEFTNEVIQLADIGTDFLVLDAANIGFQAESGLVNVDFEMINSVPPNFPNDMNFVGNYWNITDVSGGNVKLRLYYLPSETSEFTGTPIIMHFNGTNWVQLATSDEMTDGEWRYVETTDYFSNFSPVTVADGGNEVPVELVSFSGKTSSNKIILNWETATELNNNGFEIERKTENNIWKRIGFKEGKGTTTEKSNYSFIDNDVSNGNYFYRLKQVDYDGNFEYSNEIELSISLPTKFALEQNYPNPFNPTTTIRYSIPQNIVVSNSNGTNSDNSSNISPTSENNNVNVTLKIYDILGNQVSTLVNTQKAPGNYEVTFNASNLSSGVYFYRLKTSSGFIATKKLMLLK